jgi:DNA mismatch repair ATPase MutL
VPLPAAQLASRFFGGLPGGNDAQALRTSSLQDARVIEQIDRKFIASTIRLEEQHALVLLDQHAADGECCAHAMPRPSS